MPLKMPPFDQVMVFDHENSGKTVVPKPQEFSTALANLKQKARFTKNASHMAPLGRAVAGAYIMSLGLLAAYQTVPPDFDIHHLTSQFFQPGDKDKDLSFDIIRSSDRKRSAARFVSVSQDGLVICTITMDFTRRFASDELSLCYQPQLPGGISYPIEGADQLKLHYGGFIQSQNVGRAMKSNNIVENTTRQWLKIGDISAGAHRRMHHAGLTFLSDFYILDTPARLLNMQLGFGEPKIGATQEDSPYDQRTTKDNALIDFRTGPKSDFTAMVTLNHTIHFHNPCSVNADNWILSEVSTSQAYGRRLLAHSKLFSRDGGLLAVCTQECFYRLKDKVPTRKLPGSNL